MQMTNLLADQILKGQYNPLNFKASTIISQKQIVCNSMYDNVSNDSLLSYLKQMSSFVTRNTGSDTLSDNKGIGAARRWAHKKFERFSSDAENRLLVSYFQFDKLICGVGQHRNILAVLPGSDTSDKSIIIVEAHFDSRCENSCDTACLAEGVEDNGSGSAIVLELARVMSKLSLKRTIVFMLTIAEEQGLDGADAFAKYCKNNNILIRAVFNNDVVGGIICGKTSSAPGCPTENELDSINVRIFSAGTNFSIHKGLARFMKLEFEEEMLAKLNIKTIVNIMTPEDRIGRGGDHIPFKNQGYASIRITSANEHGDANPIPGYTDRQHSTRDILGKDFNSDGIFDSLYVNMGYLKRNILLNGTAIAMAANGPQTPEFDLINDGNGLSVIVSKTNGYKNFRIGFRTRQNDFDTIYTLINEVHLKTYNVKKDSIYFVSVAAIDDEEIESIFAVEKYVKVLGVPASGLAETREAKAFQIMTAIPNPADEQSTITIIKNHNIIYKEAFIRITDISGREIASISVDLSREVNEVNYEHGYKTKGIVFCSLIVDGKIFDTQKMMFR